ncbi:MAG: hypothetical protein V3U92_19280, partial [Cellulophaga sp.]
QLYTDDSTPMIQGQGLEKLAIEYAGVTSVINRLSRRYDSIFLEEMTYILPLTEEIKQSQEKMTEWYKQLEKNIAENKIKAVYSIELNYKSEDDFDLVVNKKMNGITKTFILHTTFFAGKDYLKIAQYARDTVGLFSDQSFMKIGEKQQQVSNFKQAFEWMMKEVKKGQHIQRYKGLGEMNPDQLWETTLDSNSRRLLQVKIEDVIAADEIFTTLMGDIVEPRRDFIVKNALDVANLDV